MPPTPSHALTHTREFPINMHQHAGSCRTSLGLVSLEDWIADLQSATMVDYPYCEGCQIGTGWLTACESLQPGVTEALVDIVSHHSDVDVEIVVTGMAGARREDATVSVYF